MFVLTRCRTELNTKLNFFCALVKGTAFVDTYPVMILGLALYARSPIARSPGSHASVVATTSRIAASWRTPTKGQANPVMCPFQSMKSSPFRQVALYLPELSHLW